MTRQYPLWQCSQLILLFFLLVAGGATAWAQDDEQTRLAELQAKLKERQQSLAENKSTAEELQQVLRQSEVEIGKAASALQSTRNALAANKEEQQKLTARQETLRQAIMQQQSALSEQLRSAFMAGHYDYAKMIFYQDEAQSFERVLTYYQYINKARQEQILLFRENVAELKAVTADLQQKADELVSLQRDQQAQQVTLLTRQKDREQTLAKINKQIASDAAQIEALEANERALVQAIEAARRAAERAATELAGLSGNKGKLLVPAQGRVRKLFGERRQGQVRWKGIIIEGAEGSAVKSVSRGRILYADWLKGFGLVTIIDHGDGYMSVYGHNQALLKQAGDDVSAGDTIALVGQSGGQSYPNLYFEIRHKGKALNPATWLNI